MLARAHGGVSLSGRSAATEGALLDVCAGDTVCESNKRLRGAANSGAASHLVDVCLDRDPVLFKQVSLAVHNPLLLCAKLEALHQGMLSEH
jgi:hypothetical protein